MRRFCAPTSFVSLFQLFLSQLYKYLRWEKVYGLMDCVPLASHVSYFLHSAGGQAVRLDPQLVQTGIHFLKKSSQHSWLGLVKWEQKVQVPAPLSRESNSRDHLLDREDEFTCIRAARKRGCVCVCVNASLWSLWARSPTVLVVK